MTDYIERETAIRLVQGTGYADPIKDNLLFILRTIPAVADVQPVNTAEWVIKEEYERCRAIECSRCGSRYAVSINVPFDEWKATEKRRFCGSCGSDMRGGGNHELRERDRR